MDKRQDGFDEECRRSLTPSNSNCRRAHEPRRAPTNRPKSLSQAKSCTGQGQDIKTFLYSSLSYIFLEQHQNLIRKPIVHKTWSTDQTLPRLKSQLQFSWNNVLLNIPTDSLSTPPVMESSYGAEMLKSDHATLVGEGDRI